MNSFHHIKQLFSIFVVIQIFLMITYPEIEYTPVATLFVASFAYLLFHIIPEFGYQASQYLKIRNTPVCAAYTKSDDEGVYMVLENPGFVPIHASRIQYHVQTPEDGVVSYSSTEFYSYLQEQIHEISDMDQFYYHPDQIQTYLTKDDVVVLFSCKNTTSPAYNRLVNLFMSTQIKVSYYGLPDGELCQTSSESFNY